MSTKSIYPVIGCHTNKDGAAFPSQQTIADLSGCTAKTVREGIQGLLSIPWVELKNRITTRGTRQKIYIIKPGDEGTKYFSFYKAILESGIWRELSVQYKSKAAHAIYCTCLAYAFFDFDLYAELECLDYDVNEFWQSDDFKKRGYDFLSADLDIIAYKAGVDIKTAKKAIQALINTGLLEEILDMERQTWKIRRSPNIRYNRDYLNDCLERTQPDETDFMKCGGLGVYQAKTKEKQVEKITY